MSLLIGGLALVSSLMFLLWMLQRQTGNAAVVDLGWTASVPMLHLYFAVASGHAWSPRHLLLVLLVSLWGLRLGGYLFWTRLRPGMPEEGRYIKLREEWGPHFQRNLFWFYQAQALASLWLVGVFLPFYHDSQSLVGLWELAGLGVFLLGWAGVTLADLQLHQFKSRGHRGVCQLGLWNYSRHPNYFFESLLWVGWALYVQASAGAALAWLAPATIIHLVLNVTGIPPTEAQAVRSKGDAYREYQRTTSAFVPWFKKAPSP
jgi:steroid 5-alpha reductase family enzyme